MLFIFGMVCALTFGQEVPNISPPTPEAAALGKFIDIPVSLHTGTPNISIPIVNITEQEINIPVSLNYHASGIKVNEIASRVGLGWTLNAGGMITRSVRGIADDDPQGFINTTNTVSNYFTLSSSEKNLLFQNATEGHQDYESDVYYFNYPGASGKFFFDQNGGVYSHPKNDLIINYTKDNSNKIVGWEITTEKGLIYTFGTISGTSDTVLETKQSRIRAQNQNLPLAINFYTSGWYLTQIKDHKGNSIRFNYAKGTNEIEYWNILEQKKYIQASLNGDCTTPGVSITFSEDRYFPAYLISIVTPKGSIHFDYAISRVDLKNDKALSKIELKDTNNHIVDRYLFEYGYFTTSAWEHFGNYGDLDQRTKKLYLQKIKQQKGNTINQEHEFTYYQEHPFPERFSFDRDFWDYSNGVDNQYLYPEFAYTTNAGPVHVDGGDRTVDESHAQTLLLKEIEYPTKGKTEFVYESNTVSGGAAFFAGNRLASKLIIGSQVVNSNVPGEIVSSNFTLNESGIVSYTTSFSQNCLGNPTRDCPTIKITKANGDLILTFLNINKTGVLNLEAGEYTISIKNGPFLSDGAADISFYKQTIENDNNNPSNVAKTGGLRIKEIRFKDDNGAILNTKKYTYNQYDNTGSSSGLSLNPPVFFIKNAPFRQGPNSCSFSVIQSNSIFPFNGQSTYHVGYTNVTAYNTDKEQGKTEYTYSFFADAGGFGDSNEFVWAENFYPFAPAVDYSHRRGLLIREKTYTYDKVSDTFAEVEELYNTYKKQGDIRIDNIAMGYVGSAGAGYLGYDNLSERFLLEQTEKTNRYNSGAVKTTIQYGYDSGYQGRTMPIQTTTTDSNAETIVTRSYYPDDVISATALGEDLTTVEYNTISKLKKKATQHRIAAPIQQETYINGVLTSRLRTKYKDWSTSIVLPEIVQSAKGGATLQDRIEYINYDDRGNPLEVSRVDGSPISYIWGYQQRHPIAKLENVAYADITSYVSDLQTLSDADNDRTQGYLGKEGALRQALDDLRDDLPNAMITTYTYDPLIGVTSITDPKGETIYYKYDDFNRLQYVLDQDDYVAQQMRYNYEGQGSDVLSGVTITRSTSGTITPNQEVTFTAGTTGSGTNMLYTWSVNGVEEQCDTATSFSTSFPSEGSYRVSVLAYDAQTKQSTDSVMTISTVYAGLTTPSLYESHDHITYGTMVDYSVSGIGGGSGSYRYEWYVNDVKQSAVGTSFQYTSYTTGSYRIQFKVIDKVTGKSSISSASRLGVYAELGIPSLATSVSSSYIFTGTSVTFTGGSITGGSNDLEYEWYVNGQKQSEDRLVLERTFGTSGDYTIKFRVIDDNISGHYKEKSVTIYVNPPLSRPSISANKTHIVKGTAVTFTASNVGGGSGSRRYEWYINDAKQSATGTSFTKTFSSTGTYTIKFKVVDNTIPSYALWSSNTRTVFSHNDLTTPSLSSNHTHFIKGTTVTFTAGNISGGSGSRRYEWYINNVKQSNTGATLARPFNSTGSYTVKFRVIDNSIPSYYKERSVTVKSYNALNTPSLSKSNTYFLKGGTITFTAGNIGNGSGSRRYEWYINNVKQSYAGTKLVQPFNSTGTYTVKFRVVDTTIPNHFKERSVTVYSYNPLNTPSISASKTHIVKGTEVTFTASGIGNGSGYRRYEWYVNNVKQSYTGTTYKNSFPTKGTYNVKFRVIDTRISPTHYKESNTRTVYSHTALNTPSLAKNHTYVLNGTTITFTAGSIGNGSGNRRYEWYVNNVKQSYTGTQLSYKVNSQAAYTVKFRVVDNNIPNHFKERSVTVYSYNPLVSPIVSGKTHIVKGTTVDFSTSGIGGGSGYRRYEWYVNNVKQSGTGTRFSYRYTSTGSYTVKLRVIDTRITPATHDVYSNTKTVYSYNPIRTITNQTSTQINNSNPNVTFNITSVTGGSGNYSNVTWSVVYLQDYSDNYTSTNTSRRFSFGSTRNGEYNITAKIKDTQTKEIHRKYFTVIVNRSNNGDPDPDCPNCGDQW